MPEAFESAAKIRRRQLKGSWSGPCHVRFLFAYQRIPLGPSPVNSQPPQQFGISKQSPSTSSFLTPIIRGPALFCQSCWTSDACTKDTDQCVRHGSRHLCGDTNILSRQRLGLRVEEFGRGQNTEVGWNYPTFAPVAWPNSPEGRSNPQCGSQSSMPALQ